MEITKDPLRGSLFGGVLLIAGCCIGAGMLGLPVVSAQAGFFPSLLMFVAGWLFMTCTGFLLLEVNLWYGGNVNVITMAQRTLGRPGQIVAWVAFLFLFYLLMVAYIAGSGALIADFIQQICATSWHPSLGGLLFCLIFGFLLYKGAKAVDWFNRWMMLGLVVSYLALVAGGVDHVKSEFLSHQNWTAAPAILPIVIISFGFHNLIPSLTTYLNGDIYQLKWSIILGSLLSLLIYVIWQLLILGVVPLTDFKHALNQGEIATEALQSVVQAPWILNAAQAFAFFAIVTSFLGVGLSFMDFLADGFHIQKTAKGKFSLILLILAPPFLCALFYPSVFLVALNSAGAFGAVTLFGLLPALMVWQGRYVQRLHHPKLIPGGKPVVLALMAFAFWVILLQFIQTE